jgi:hypothetical protein
MSDAQEQEVTSFGHDDGDKHGSDKEEEEEDLIERSSIVVS